MNLVIKMANFDFLLLFFLSFSVILRTHEVPTSFPPSLFNNLPSQCPIDLSYVLRIPWKKTACQNYQPAADDNNNLRNDIFSKDPCCRTLLSLLGIGLAQHLKKTSLFQLPDLNTSISCLKDFQEILSSISFPNNIVNACFNPLDFVLSPNLCAHVEKTQDWVDKLGKSTVLDSACRPDLLDLTACKACVAAGSEVHSSLILLDGNKTHSTDCFYFTVLYAGGIVNEFGPESDGSITCIFGLDLDSSLSSTSKGHSALVFGLTGAIVAVLVLSGLLGLCFWFDKKGKKKRNPGSGLGSVSGFGMEENGYRPKLRPNAGSIWFKIQDLEKATENFSDKNFIGRGGFGFVYKGVLIDGTIVAVKKIIESDFHGNAEFCNEVEIISNLKHRNLVSLRGCCVVDEGNQRYLVYDYMPNGNLNDYLFPSFDNHIAKKLLTWPQRKNIILDVAKGLAYLHYGVKPAIYHRDIKGTNILLDGEMRARLADFGLVKQSREGQSHVTTRVAGTHGYLAPEYALYGQLTEKSDIYSFGIVVLEIMCGRKALDSSSPGSPRTFLITDWVWSLVKAGKVEEALDSSLLGDNDLNSNPKYIMKRFVLVGILCAHIMAGLRPSIMDALKMLEGDIEVPIIPNRPLPLSHPCSFNDGNNFSISQALSFPQLHSEDMHR